eukprot:267789_1
MSITIINRLQSLLTSYWNILWWTAMVLSVLEFSFYLISLSVLGIDSWSTKYHPHLLIVLIQFSYLIGKMFVIKPVSMLQYWKIVGLNVSCITTRKKESDENDTSKQADRVIKWILLFAIILDIVLSIFVAWYLFQSVDTPLTKIKLREVLPYNGLRGNRNHYFYYMDLPPKAITDVCYDKYINQSIDMFTDVYVPFHDSDDTLITPRANCSFEVGGKRKDVYVVDCDADPGINFIVKAMMNYTCIHDTLSLFKWKYAFELSLTSAQIGTDANKRALFGSDTYYFTRHRIVTPDIPVTFREMEPANIIVSITQCKAKLCADHRAQLVLSSKSKLFSYIAHLISFASSLTNIIFYCKIRDQISQTLS